MSTTTRGRPIGTLTVALLQKLADAPEPLSTSQLVQALADQGTENGIRSAIDRVRGVGCVNFLPSTVLTALAANGKAPRVLSLTAAGYRRLRDAKAAHAAAQAGPDTQDHTAGQSTGLPPELAVAAPRAHAPAGAYSGAELRTTSARPGAMDAYALPSLVEGRRTERRAPIIMGASPQQPTPRSWR